MSRKTSTPTSEQYNGLQAAYDYFNKKLFGDELADCIITLKARGKRTIGLFHAEQWQRGEETAHEIALSPMYLRRPIRDVFSTLVHEMCHLWQQDFGKPSRTGYHNKEWGTKMKDVGLYPSNTGEPGGKETGQQMTHYIVEHGPFATVVDEMPESIRLPWIGVEPVEKEKKTNTKVKYCCPTCDTTAWGKPALSLICGDCQEEMEAQE